MSIVNTDINKKDLRIKFRAIRNSITNKMEPAQQLKNNFLAHIKLNGKKIISSYIPINSEIDVMPLARHLASMEHNIVMPVEDKINDILIFKKCIFIEGAPHIKEETLEPEILIVPMLAFDKSLMRLGYGGGWYDKTISHFKKTNRNNKLLIGVAYSLQFSNESLPRNDFDQILDIIITEDGAYKS